MLRACERPFGPLASSQGYSGPEARWGVARSGPYSGPLLASESCEARLAFGSQRVLDTNRAELDLYQARAAPGFSLAGPHPVARAPFGEGHTPRGSHQGPGRPPALPPALCRSSPAKRGLSFGGLGGGAGVRQGNIKGAESSLVRITCAGKAKLFLHFLQNYLGVQNASHSEGHMRGFAPHITRTRIIFGSTKGLRPFGGPFAAQMRVTPHYLVLKLCCCGILSHSIVLSCPAKRGITYD